jgi:hypothetical protein
MPQCLNTAALYFFYKSIDSLPGKQFKFAGLLYFYRFCSLHLGNGWSPPHFRALSSIKHYGWASFPAQKRRRGDNMEFPSHAYFARNFSFPTLALQNFIDSLLIFMRGPDTLDCTCHGRRSALLQPHYKFTESQFASSLSVAVLGVHIHDLIG